MNDALDSYEPQLMSWASKGISISEMVKRLKSEYNVPTHWNMINNWFDARGGSKQYHPKVHMKDELIALSERMSYEDISSHLLVEYDIDFSVASIRKWFLEWGISKQTPKPKRRRVTGIPKAQFVNPYSLYDCFLHPVAQGTRRRMSSMRTKLR